MTKCCVLYRLCSYAYIHSELHGLRMGGCSRSLMKSYCTNTGISLSLSCSLSLSHTHTLTGLYVFLPLGLDSCVSSSPGGLCSWNADTTGRNTRGKKNWRVKKKNKTKKNNKKSLQWFSQSCANSWTTEPCVIFSSRWSKYNDPVMWHIHHCSHIREKHWETLV